jgi:hypothetical protein
MSRCAALIESCNPFSAEPLAKVGGNSQSRQIRRYSRNMYPPTSIGQKRTVDAEMAFAAMRWFSGCMVHREKAGQTSCKA